MLRWLWVGAGLSLRRSSRLRTTSMAQGQAVMPRTRTPMSLRMVPLRVVRASAMRVQGSVPGWPEGYWTS